MSAGDVKHDYHLVNPSPWPLVGSLAACVMAVGGVIASCVRAMPTHQDFIARHCAAPMAA